MIEGQEDVTWEDWVALADTCERCGIEALFRSDHYLSVLNPPTQAGERGALDAWGTLNALAARTTSLRLGTMVSPTSFRHPSVLAKLVVTADHVSNGRIELGMGTGWSEIEHTAMGFPFLAMKERPTAIFTANDEMAIGLIAGLRQQGVECPRDISVIGFDDITVSQNYAPALTTMRQPREELGRVATEMLINILEGTVSAPEPAHVVLASELIVRESTARIG